MTSSTPKSPPKAASETSGPSIPSELAQVAQAARESAQQVLATVPLLGHVSWLMLQQSVTRNTLLGDLEWRVLPALLLKQAKLYSRDNTPLAFASWAMLSDEAALRYRGAPHKLAAADWKSGDQIWLIDMFTPFGGAMDLLQDLRQGVFAGQPVHQLAPAAGGLADVVTWPAQPPKA